MSGTLQASVVKDSASATNNLNLDSSGNVAVGNNMTVAGTLTGSTGILNIGSGQIYKDASGNVGIGTSSPTAKVQIYTNGAPAASGNMTTGMAIASAAGSYAINIGADATAGYTWLNSAYINSSNTASPMVFMTGASERMRLDSSGNVLVGTTVTNGTNTTGAAILNPSSSTAIVVGHITGTVSGTSYLYMNYNGTNIGSITQSGTTAVAYNTSSDYRLKENVTPMTVGLATISALKPVTYDWVGTNENGEGFIAHELQEVIPHAVTGIKDAVDDDGKPVYQGVDYSKIVVHLVAAIQELSAKNDALEARIAKLESK